MIIRTNYSSLTSVLALGNLLVSPKEVPENMKAMYLCVENGRLVSAVSDGTVYCKYFLEGEYDLEGEDNPRMVVGVKELSFALSKYSSLSRTQVKEIVLQTFKNGIILTVNEEAKQLKDPNMFTHSDMYDNLSTKYKLTSFTGIPRIFDEISKVALNEKVAKEVDGKEFRKYLDYFYSPMTKPKKSPELIFNDELVYTIMGNVVGIAMPNTLPKDIFSSINLRVENIKFLQNVISTENTFKVDKVEESSKVATAGDWVSIQSVLTFQTDNIIIRMKCVYKGDAPGYSCFSKKMQNAVMVDKPYFLDTLKRLDGADSVYVNIKIDDNPSDSLRPNAQFIIQTNSLTYRIPVNQAHGSGEFKFSVTPSNLAIMVFSHLKQDMDGQSDQINDLIFCMENTEKDITHLSCCDKSNDWQTRYPRAQYLQPVKLDF